MTGLLLAALLLSAALHAGWNAASRMRRNQTEAFASIVIASGLWALAALPFTGVPALAALPWLGAGILLNLVAMHGLIAAYDRTGFAVAYPVGRGLTPLMVLFIAYLLTGEWPRWLALVGLGLICLAILALGLIARRAGGTHLSGIAYAALGAAGAGGAAACDAVGVRLSGNTFGYAMLIAIANAVAFAILLRLEGRRPLAGLREAPIFASLLSFGSMLSYIIVLTGFTIADAALVAAVRETSVLFATAFAALLLKERLTRLHWLASALAAVGVMLIRLG
jgi:drug/metabolite transporter (DMT)-like permease